MFFVKVFALGLLMYGLALYDPRSMPRETRGKVTVFSDDRQAFKIYFPGLQAPSHWLNVTNGTHPLLDIEFNRFVEMYYLPCNLDKVLHPSVRVLRIVGSPVKMLEACGVSVLPELVQFNLVSDSLEFVSLGAFLYNKKLVMVNLTAPSLRYIDPGVLFQSFFARVETNLFRFSNWELFNISLPILRGQFLSVFRTAYISHSLEENYERLYQRDLTYSLSQNVDKLIGLVEDLSGKLDDLKVNMTLQMRSTEQINSQLSRLEDISRTVNGELLESFELLIQELRTNLTLTFRDLVKSASLPGSKVFSVNDNNSDALTQRSSFN